MDDLMKDSYEYVKLERKYGGFQVPAVKVYDKGKDILEQWEISLIQMELILSLDGSGSAQLELGEVYEEKTRSLRNGVMGGLKPGTILEIAIGYGSCLQKVFKGFVYRLEMSCGETVHLNVTVLDVRKLMMECSRKRMFTLERGDRIFEELMKPYKNLCSTKVDTEQAVLTQPVVQEGDDYHFLTEVLAPRCGCEFFVFGNHAYFRKRPKQEAPLLTAEFGRELLRLEMAYTYLDSRLQIQGRDRERGKIFTSSQTVTSKETQSPVLPQPSIRIMESPESGSQSAADFLAGQEAYRMKEGAKGGKGICIGLPELVPGRFIRINNMDVMLNKTYYMEEIRHRISGAFFTTEFTIGGWQ